MPSVTSSIDGSRQIDGTKMQLESLELAGCTLDRYINADNSRPTFLEITGIAAQQSPTCSGLNAGDYKNLAALLNHPNLSQMKVINKVPLPPEIMEHFAHMQCHCLMGVFPEISRVWLTIDSNIYVWAFEHGSDVAYFDGLGETIVSVGLVKPKPGVFQHFVKYLLVLTTTVEIVVLGVTFSSTKDGSEEFEEMHLVPEPVFVLPTDGVSMMSVKSSSKGRIFMGGKDGCLYEITYQAQLGWFGKHCKKINHSTSALSFLVPSFLNAALYDEDAIVKIEIDNSRHILYTLSEKGCIEVFDLGKDGDGLSKVTRLTQAKIVSLAVDIVKTLEANNFKPVISISAVDESESEHLHLVAVTQTGARLYFSCGVGDSNQQGLDSRPSYLTLIHVRLPPGFTPNAAVLKPKQVHSASYDNGTLMMVCSSGGSEAETLWCLSRALPAPSFCELHSLLALDGPAWAVTPLNTHAQHNTRRDPWAESRWAVVTGAGASVVAAGAAPALLRALLRDCRGADAKPVHDFFQLQNLDQACACAVYLACEDSSAEVSEWAARAFFLYGSQPPQPPSAAQYNMQYQQQNTQFSVLASPKFSPRQMSTPMAQRGPQGQLPFPKMNQPSQQGPNQSFLSSPNQSYAGQSPFPQNLMSPGFNQSFSNVNQQRDPNNFPIQMEFSAKHNALYIYVGRILAPLWNMKCVNMSTTPDNKEFLVPGVEGGAAGAAAARLCRAAAFLPRVPPAAQHERDSLRALQHFLTLSVELLSLWQVLCEHQFHAVAAALPPDHYKALQNACFREVMVGGLETLSLLLGALVAGYLRDHASVDGISHKLRHLCPTLYRQEDATCSKANELLIFAKQQKNPDEREEMLQQALKLCKDVAPNVNLGVVCGKLIAAGFYSGVVELCVTCARRLDPQDKALHYYRSEHPPPDRDAQLPYYTRMEIYREVCAALERLYEGYNREPASGSPRAFEAPSTSVEDHTEGRKFIWECLSQDDELLHVAVYEWLISKGLGSELLSLGAPAPQSLREYLSRRARAAGAGAGAGGGAALLDLLWRVLQQAGDQLAAAAVLEGLATTPGGATLEQRMSWLSAGVVCVRGATGAGGGGVGGAGAGGAGELLRRLEEALEVAGVQRRVRAAALALPPARRPPPAAMQRLDTHLLEITQLYEEYADRYQLWECKLAIVQCSGHNDPILVENIWSNILAEAEANAKPLPTPDEKMAAVLGKVTTLGKEYGTSGHCFPLYFIVRQLEIMSCKLQAEHSLVFNAMLNLGVSLEQILDIYIKLVSVGDRAWAMSGDELHACAVSARLVERCARPPAAARRARARARDLSDAARAAAQARPNTQALIDRIAAAQAHLDRVVD